jgi:hypothetical protein
MENESVGGLDCEDPPHPAHLRLMVLKDNPCGEVAPHSIGSVFGLSTRTGKESGDDSVSSARPLFVARLARFGGILRLPVDRIAFVANREHGYELLLCPARGCGEPKLRCGHALHPPGDPGAGRAALGSGSANERFIAKSLVDGRLVSGFSNVIWHPCHTGRRTDKQQSTTPSPASAATPPASAPWSPDRRTARSGTGQLSLPRRRRMARWCSSSAQPRETRAR